MTRCCDDVRRVLAEGGAPALKNDAAGQAHLAECEECFAFAEALAEMDATLPELSGSRDAPDDVVARALLAVQQTRLNKPVEAAVPTAPTAPSDLVPAPVPQSAPYQIAPIPPTPPRAISARFRWRRVILVGLFAAAPAMLVIFVLSGSMSKARYADEAMVAPDSSRLAGRYQEAPAEARDQAKGDDAPEPMPVAAPATEAVRVAAMEAEGGAAAGAVADDRFANEKKAMAQRVDGPVPAAPRPSQPASKEEADAKPTAPRGGAALGKLAQRYSVSGTTEAVLAAEAAQGKGGRVQRHARENADSKDSDESAVLDGVAAAPGRKSPVGIAKPSGPANAFFAERERVEGLAFQEAAGYFQNTYLPGDPEMRAIEAQLSAADRSVLGAYQSLGLEAEARQASQTFDSPDNAALAVYVHADRRGSDGPVRTLVQIGLAGSKRRGGARPEMNVGLLLDLRSELSPEGAQRLRAMLKAFGKAREVGDNFSVTVAGKPGGLILQGDNFRYGPLEVALKALLGDGDPLSTSGAQLTLSLPEAMRAAARAVGQTDDPQAPLGSSLIVVVTANDLSADVGELAPIAHEHALAGIATSVVGIGAQPFFAPTELALAGQGHRRVLDRAADAENLVAEELSASSTVVARAVRLRIRLSPGTRLIDVVGSRRLDDASAQQVRAAEQSIDQRVARSLGVAADRGNDEEGIQIVIPSFHAGDSHVILLDVVASGPGPIADVTVRYKDLVHFKNGVARAALSLERGTGERGPIELSVLKNFVSHQVAVALRAAADAVSTGQYERAFQQVETTRTLVDGMRSQVVAFQRDRDLLRDSTMLSEYYTLLNQPAVSSYQTLAEQSLRSAGNRKLVNVR